jgi:hypothetical protein
MVVPPGQLDVSVYITFSELGKTVQLLSAIIIATSTHHDNGDLHEHLNNPWMQCRTIVLLGQASSIIFLSA